MVEIGGTWWYIGGGKTHMQNKWTIQGKLGCYRGYIGMTSTKKTYTENSQASPTFTYLKPEGSFCSCSVGDGAE